MTEMLEKQARQEDYFGFTETKKFIFPDKATFIEFRVMNEGDKSDFQKATQNDVILERNSGNARMKMDPASERHKLIEVSVVSWNLRRNGQPLPYTRAALKDFLKLTDPRLIENLEKEIRKANPWLLQDMKSDDIRKQISELEEMLAVAEERERGE